MTQQANSLQAEPAAQLLASPLPLASPARLLQSWGRRETMLLLALLAVWPVVRPWMGVWHDGQLYAVQAMHLLYPEQFSKDLYFLFGSQDQFTLFSPLHSAFIRAFGLTGAAVVLQALGDALWLAGAACLLRPFLRGFPFWLGLALLVTLPSAYGPTRVFSLAEQFLTPRMFAEAFCMFGLGLALRGKWLRAGAALGLALLLHPLMAAGALLVSMLYLAWGRWRLAAVLAGAGAALLLGAAALGIAPFNRILQQMDPIWVQNVMWTAPMVVWDAWHAADWLSRTALAFALVLAAAYLSDGVRARFYACVALAGAMGLFATWAGTGLTHNLLLIQGQPWRVLWLLQLAAVIALAWLLAAFWQRGRVSRLLLVALMVAELNRNTFGGALAVLAALGMCLEVRRPVPLAIPPRTYRLVIAGLLAIGSFWLLELLPAVEVNEHYGVEPMQVFLVAMRTGPGALAAGALLWCLWRWAGRPQRSARVLAWCLALSTPALTALWWQQRSENLQLMPATALQEAQARFLPLIPRQAVVYWENEVRLSWFVLQRSSYVSSAQLSGAAFNRSTAIEGERRLARLQHLGMYDSVREHDPNRRHELQNRLPQPSKAGLAYVCADPILDFVVLSNSFGDSVVAQWYYADAETTFYLHDCARLRASLVSH